ncbi:MAG: GNAT family N-acetyltransferase [Gemmatimonadales bacterium]
MAAEPRSPAPYSPLPASPAGGTIHPATVADAPRFAAFAEQIFRETFGPDNRPDDMDAYVAASYGPGVQAREIADRNIGTLLVEAEGELVGFAQVRASAVPACVTGPAPVELWRFYVHRRWQGSGLAGHLMRAVEREAIRRGGRTLWLAVWERNPRATSFYLKCGFEDVGEQAFVLGRDHQRDRVLVRPLPEPGRS